MGGLSQVLRFGGLVWKEDVTSSRGVGVCVCEIKALVGFAEPGTELKASSSPPRTVHAGGKALSKRELMRKA